jgi:hypothetical protein
MTRQRLSSADTSTAIILQVYNNLCARSCTLELVYAFALSPTRQMVLFVRIGLKPQGGQCYFRAHVDLKCNANRIPACFAEGGKREQSAHIYV